MKFYRVHISGDDGLSRGFVFCLSKREVSQIPGYNDPEKTHVERVDIEPTKRGIRRALTRYASHPDNG